MDVDKHLLALGNLHKRKNEEYGDSYHSHGNVMLALFPNGVHLKTELDFGRYGLLVHIVGKINRYAKNFNRGHADSLDDISVYAAMLRDLDGDL